jgi:hypothetical protein
MKNPIFVVVCAVACLAGGVDCQSVAFGQSLTPANPAGDLTLVKDGV